jgi:aminobenzoyl-glutamate utilization protein B
MNTAWNFRREHLRISQRTHYVITNGGDQPNVVPSLASVWYYYRELDYENIKKLFDIGEKISKAAAAMTDTEVESRILGSAWPLHFNKVIAETMYENIKTVGLPKWSEADQKLAIALQDEMKFDPGEGEGGPWAGVRGLRTDLGELLGPVPEPRTGGGSDDIGDVSWTVPTVTLSFPSNFESGGGHHWSSAVAMATPIAHKGATVGSKVMAATALDFFLDPAKVEASWKYFNEEQTKDVKYLPLIRETDQPPIHLNREIMAKFRDQMKKLYYDPTKHDTYLEQLGIEYPTVRKK